MTLVVDASVAVKWVVDEPDSPRARIVAGSGAALVAPEIVLAESGNVLWRLVRTRRISPMQAAAAELELRSAFDRLTPTAELVGEALEIAIRIDHPIYDCFYIALARRLDADLVTSDARLTDHAAASGVKVRHLANFAS